MSRILVLGGSQDRKVWDVHDHEGFVKVARPVEIRPTDDYPMQVEFQTEVYRRQSFGFGDTERAIDFMVHEDVDRPGAVIARWIEGLIDEALK